LFEAKKIMSSILEKYYTSGSHAARRGEWYRFNSWRGFMLSDKQRKLLSTANDRLNSQNKEMHPLGNRKEPRQTRSSLFPSNSAGDEEAAMVSCVC